MSDHQAVLLQKNGKKKKVTRSSVSSSSDAVPDPEVVQRAKRRFFTTGYKLRILNAADGCKQGEIGALLRREGLYSSNLSTWRRQRERGELGQKKRGRPGIDPKVKEVARLRAQNARLAVKLEQAETIIEVQKKLSVLLGLTNEATQKADDR